MKNQNSTLGGFLGRPLGALGKTCLPLMKNVATPLAKSVFIPLKLTSAAKKENGWNGWYYENSKSLQESDLFIKGGNETIENEAKGKKWVS